MFAGPQDCSADEFGELVECQTKNENAPNYGDTCAVTYIGMYFLNILATVFWRYPELNHNTCWKCGIFYLLM